MFYDYDLFFVIDDLKLGTWPSSSKAITLLGRNTCVIIKEVGR